MEIKEEIKRLTEEVKSISEQLQKLRQYADDECEWKPKDGDVFYYLDSTESLIVEEEWGESGFGFYKKLLREGNYYKTYEEALFELERFKVALEMRRYVEKNRPWDNITQHFQLMYDFADGKVFIVRNYFGKIKVNDIYFENEAQAKKCINAVGVDRIIKYYFGVNKDE